ncbi:MAG: Dps family protein [bacterium]|nr:Dps family protein [bacterium]
MSENIASISSGALKANIGLEDGARQGIVNILCATLADQIVLRTKTQNYHWNVTGPHFRALHLMFEEQYNELGEVIDETAEFIRSYGSVAPGTLAEFLQIARLKEEPGVVPDANGMIARLVADHEAVIQNLRSDCDTIDDDYDDVAAEDYLTGLIERHLKMAWMLRSMIS